MFRPDLKYCFLPLHDPISVGSVLRKTIFMPRHSKNGGEALSVTPVRPCVRPSVRPLSKYVVRSITFERLHGFKSNLICLYIISKHRSSSIWVTIH